MRRGPRTAALVTLLAACLAVAGCASLGTHPKASPSASATHAAWPVIQKTGVGQIDIPLTMEPGVHSVHIVFACTAGGYSIMLMGKDGSDRSGWCGGASTYDLPIGDVPVGQRVQLSVSPPNDAHYALSVQLRADRVHNDASLASQCSVLSTILSVYQNTEDGYRLGEVTADQWHTAVDAANLKLAALVKTAPKAGPSSSLFASVLPDLQAWATGDGDQPGQLVYHATPNGFNAAWSLAGQLCTANGSSLVVRLTHGG